MNPLKLRQIVCAPAGDGNLGGSESGVTGTLTQAKQTISTTARDTAARLKSAAGETATRARDEAQRLASETKEQAAARVSGYSNSLHESAKAFEQQDPNIAWATHQLADKIEGISSYIRSADLNTLRDDVGTFARRHPLAFFGGLFVGGLVIGNLLKARQPSAEDYGYAGDMNSDDYAGSSVSQSGMINTGLLGTTGNYDAGNPSGSGDTFNPSAGGSI